MSNKTQLQTNNTALDTLITRVNAAKDTAASLPEAGSGSTSIETFTLTFKLDDMAFSMNYPLVVCYTDDNGLPKTAELYITPEGTSIIVQKGIVVLIDTNHGGFLSVGDYGNINVLYGVRDFHILSIDSDSLITFI